MNRIIIVLLVFAIVLSAISLLTGQEDDFSIEKYLESLNAFPERPPFPEDKFHGENFFASVGNGFMTIVNYIAYPFKYIGYIFECAKIIVGGLFEW